MKDKSSGFPVLLYPYLCTPLSRMKKLLFLMLTLPILASGAEPGAFRNWLTEKPAAWYNATSFSLITTTGQSMNGIQTSFGYRFNPWLGVGLGVGLERFTGMATYDEYKANLSHLPFFAEVRYTALRSMVSPFAAVQGGYKFLLNIPSTDYRKETVVYYPGYFWDVFYDNDTYRQGGLFFSAEAGLRVRMYERFALNLAAGYSLWTVSGDRNHWLYEYLPDGQNGTKETIYFSTEPTKAILHTFMLRVGFGF